MVKIIHWYPQDPDMDYPYSFAMSWSLKSKMLDWIKENKIDAIYTVEIHKTMSYEIISFKTEEEAAGFKLMWT